MLAVSDPESPLSRLLPARTSAVSADDGFAAVRIPYAGDVQLVVDHPAFAPALLKISSEKPWRIFRGGGRGSC